MAVRILPIWTLPVGEGALREGIKGRVYGGD